MPNHRATEPLKVTETSPLPEVQSQTAGETAALKRQTMRFAAFLVVLCACFYAPLWKLWQFAINDDFFSYIPLIPAITVYLIWIQRRQLPRPNGVSWLAVVITAAGGLAMSFAALWAARTGSKLELEDYLALTTSSFVLFLAAGCFACFGSAISRAVQFPLAFLIFMIPMPSFTLHWTENFFQQTSAVTASAFLSAAGMPVYREGLLLHLPGIIPILVAPECSGIHSTMVLLITALLAGHMFLRSGRRRALLAIFVIPLAIARNGFRIFVIGELCVRVSQDMIDSPIHHKGGPIFFALSLIPFFLMLFLLRKSELRGSNVPETDAKG